MILIADSGSTKTDWALVRAGNGEVVATYKTQGINPVHQSPEAIREILGTLSLPPVPLTALYFYGAGCTPAHIPLMQQLLDETLHTPSSTPPGTEVQSDLMAAARALCGREAGIACILGTGANSCLYDGSRIVQNTPALGYILGDEGSGAVLGRSFLNAIFKNPALSAVRDDFLAVQRLTLADIIQRVYREPMANRFLASTSLYIGRHLDHPVIRSLVVDNFRQFFRSNIVPYQCPDLPVHFVGSIAYHFHDCLAEAAKAEHFVLGRVEQAPMQGLIAFHTLI